MTAERWRRTARLLTAGVVAAATLIGCGGDGRTSGPSASASTIEADAAVFCEAIESALASGDDDAGRAALALAPAEIADTAAAVAAGDAGAGTGGADEAGRRLLVWIELRCHPEDAQPGAAPADRRVAPPVDTLPKGVAVCRAGFGLGGPSSETLSAILYADPDADDPFAGEALGLLWGRDTSFDGDGDRTPVTVRGRSGVAAPITVFQQAVLPDLGTVVTWQEDGVSVGLFGRGFGADRTAELVAAADAVQRGDGGSFELPAGRLPTGWAEVYRGSSDPLGLVLAPGSAYEVRLQYGADPSVWTAVTVEGRVESEEAFAATRFLTIGLRRQQLAGREVWAGDAWHAGGGPYVVTWREDDGLVVRVVGFGSDVDVDVDLVRTLASEARELHRGEWEDLVGATEGCDVSAPSSPSPSAPPTSS